MIESGLVIGLSFISFIFAYLGINIEREHAPLKWLFLIMSLTFMTVTVFVMYLVSSANKQLSGLLGNSVLYTPIIALIFVIAYFLLYFLSTILSKANPSYGKNG